MFRFATPWALALLPLALVAVWLMARRRKRADARLALPLAAIKVRLAVSPWVRLERALPWLRGLALLLIVISIARPQSGARIQKSSTLGVDIVVSMDISGSMRAEDFRPDNRLAVSRRTVEQFIEGRGPDRIGLVVFAGLATTRCPLTSDHQMLRQFLQEIDFAPADQDGTALGMGLATAVNRLRDSQAKSKLVVLVTDGVNNRGQIGPRAAAEAARALGVKVYTVGVGSDGEVPVPIDLGAGRGTRVIMQEVELDEELLQEIAEATEGRYFRATDPEGLRQVFETIDSLEKTQIDTRERVLYSELFLLSLLPAAGLILIERFLAATRLRRIP